MTTNSPKCDANGQIIGWSPTMTTAAAENRQVAYREPASEAERVANARLIAAAPDLLAALRLALARYESAKRLHVGRFVNDDADMATIRAAIARAE